MIFRINKTLIATVLLAIGMASCSACGNTPPASSPDATPTAAPTPSVPVPPLPVPTNILVKRANWELTLPGTQWDIDTTSQCDSGVCSVAYQSKDNLSLVMFISEIYSGTYDQYVIETIRGIKDAGATIASAKAADLSGNAATVIAASKDAIRVWTWVTVIGGHGYNLSCGGSIDNHDLCFGVASTVKIN